MPLVLFNPYVGAYQVLPRRARVDLGAMAIKGYSAFPKAPATLEPQHQIVLCYIQDTHWRGFTPLQGSSRCILQPQPTGQYICIFDRLLSTCYKTPTWSDPILTIWYAQVSKLLTVGWIQIAIRIGDQHFINSSEKSSKDSVIYSCSKYWINEI